MTARPTQSLFRATRVKRREPTPALLAVEPSMRPQPDRRAHDFYPTGQPEAIRALLSVDGPAIRSCGSTWEPAVGDGALAREITAHGLPCIGSDLIDRGHPETIIRSYYDWDHAPARAIITNPPFAEINARDGHGRWLRQSLQMQGWDYMALLLSWDWPAARQNGLGALLDQHPFSWCYLMRWKLDFTGEGSPPQCNAWFVWDRRDPRGPNHPNKHPDFRWLDRTDARQQEMTL